MEMLGRGVVAMRQNDGKVFVGWRMLGSDQDDIAFNLYRVGSGSTPVKLNDKPISGATNFVDENAKAEEANAYFVRSIVDGKEQKASASFTLAANEKRAYLSIPL